MDFKKVAGYERFKEDEINLPESFSKINYLYADCLRLTLNQIPDCDISKVSLIHIQETLETNVFYMGTQLGVISTKNGYNNDDFIENKITYVVQFTPTKLL